MASDSAGTRLLKSGGGSPDALFRAPVEPRLQAFFIKILGQETLDTGFPAAAHAFLHRGAGAADSLGDPLIA